MRCYKTAKLMLVTVCVCMYNFVLLFTYFPGIDFKIKTVELRGKKIKLQIW